MSTTTVTHVPVTGGSIAVDLTGPPEAPAIVFLHGWPQDRSAFSAVTDLAQERHRCISMDLPGIGDSQLETPRGDKAHLAALVHEALHALDVDDAVLVGHDAGAMIAFAYLRSFADLRAAVLMDSVIPGVEPWGQVLANPWLWHFAFHAIPELPERLVAHEVGPYLDYFFDAVSGDPAAITTIQRQRYTAAYTDPTALRQGFELYRSFPQDVADNTAAHPGVSTPTLYLRGELGGGDLTAYRDGLQRAGLEHLDAAGVTGAGHFTPTEQPAALWATIERWLTGSPAGDSHS